MRRLREHLGHPGVEHQPGLAARLPGDGESGWRRLVAEPLAPLVDQHRPGPQHGGLGAQRGGHERQHERPEQRDRQMPQRELHEPAEPAGRWQAPQPARAPRLDEPQAGPVDHFAVDEPGADRFGHPVTVTGGGRVDPRHLRQLGTKPLLEVDAVAVVARGQYDTAPCNERRSPAIRAVGRDAAHAAIGRRQQLDDARVEPDVDAAPARLAAEMVRIGARVRQHVVHARMPARRDRASGRGSASRARSASRASRRRGRPAGGGTRGCRDRRMHRCSGPCRRSARPACRRCRSASAGSSRRH